jgi:trans-aconitate 2-methyltransferase
VSDTTKRFGPIRDDYTFFLNHSTEPAAALAGYAPHLEALAASAGPVRMLDFGCGDGGFTAEVLTRSRFAPERLRLSLVEPDDGYRGQAVARLGAFTAHPVQAWPALPPGLRNAFDLALSNHALYYVPDLDGVLAAVLASLAARGLFLTAIAGQRNTLIQFWNRCFALIGKSVPYHTAEDVAAALTRLGAKPVTEEAPYELVFPDSEENRLRIMRFLMGEHFAEVPRAAMLALFDPYASGGTVAIRTAHEHFVVRRESGHG